MSGVCKQLFESSHISHALTTVAIAIRYLIIEAAPESFELDNLPHASGDTSSSPSTFSRNLTKMAQRLSRPKPNETASDAKNPFDLQAVFPALRFAIVKPERPVNRGPYYRDVEATACDVYCYGKSKWEEVSVIMASSTAANRYLSDPSLSNPWYYDHSLIPTEKERQGIRSVVVRPGGTLIAASSCREKHHYRHFVLPNLLCIRVAAGLENQDRDALKACVEYQSSPTIHDRPHAQDAAARKSKCTLDPPARVERHYNKCRTSHLRLGIAATPHEAALRIGSPIAQPHG